MWLGASVVFGLGVGLSSVRTTPTQPPRSNPTADGELHRLHLADYLGQLFVPPIVGYMNHLAVAWRYSCILSTALLALSVLLAFALVADLIAHVLRASRRFRYGTNRSVVYKPLHSFVDHGEDNARTADDRRNSQQDRGSDNDNEEEEDILFSVPLPSEDMP